MKRSIEQQKVIDNLTKGYNVVVSGVAGCGKTTTILNVCAEFHDKKVMVLTYNARLKQETREKAEALNLTNAEIHSFHALCYKYYTKKGRTDEGIIWAIKHNRPPKPTLAFDMLIIDECQDMSKTYFDLVMKVLHDNKASNDVVQIALLGDEQQNIFDFKKADERFLTFGHKLFVKYPSHREWEHVSTHTSYRVTKPIAHFVNKYLNGYDKMKSLKNGAPVLYMCINAFKPDMIYQQISRYLNKGYSPDDIFILAPSIKRSSASSPSPIIRLENMLVKDGFPCYAPISDEGKIDEDVIKGKIVFSTFHQVKGLERKVVIIFNFDAKYFTYFAKNAPRHRCPNPIYVAATRAIEHLCIIHHHENQPLMPSMTYDDLSNDKHITFVCESDKDNYESKEEVFEQHKVGVTQLIRFLEAEELSNASRKIEFITIPNDSVVIKLPQKVEGSKKGTMEAVYDINGYAIPAMFELQQTGSCTIVGLIQTHKEDIEPNEYQKFKGLLKNKLHTTLSYNDILYISTLFDACMNGYTHRLKQIKTFDWIDTNTFESCINTLKKHIGDIKLTPDIQFEKTFLNVNFLKKYKLTGIVDVVNGTTNELWEIKCTTQTLSEHIIQLACYAWLCYETTRQPYRYCLLNVCTNEVVTLLYDHIAATDMIDYLLKCRYEKKHRLTDLEFIASVLE